MQHSHAVSPARAARTAAVHFQAGDIALYRRTCRAASYIDTDLVLAPVAQRLVLAVSLVHPVRARHPGLCSHTITSFE